MYECTLLTIRKIKQTTLYENCTSSSLIKLQQWILMIIIRWVEYRKRHMDDKLIVPKKKKDIWRNICRFATVLMKCLLTQNGEPLRGSRRLWNFGISDKNHELKFHFLALKTQTMDWRSKFLNQRNKLGTNNELKFKIRAPKT